MNGGEHGGIITTRDYEKYGRAVGCRLDHNTCVSDGELLELEAPYIENSMRMYKEVYGEEPGDRDGPALYFRCRELQVPAIPHHLRTGCGGGGTLPPARTFRSRVCEECGRATSRRPAWTWGPIEHLGTGT